MHENIESLKLQHIKLSQWYPIPDYATPGLWKSQSDNEFSVVISEILTMNSEIHMKIS